MTQTETLLSAVEMRGPPDALTDLSSFTPSHARLSQSAARKYFGQNVVELENLGSYNCRKVAGRQAQSEHSTANAIDISAFVLADGTRISLINDWAPGDKRSEFLHAVRDGSCGLFSTLLSPDYNRAHADHFHLDMAARTAGWTVCR